jgi:hypothetical protein
MGITTVRSEATDALVDLVTDAVPTGTKILLGAPHPDDTGTSRSIVWIPLADANDSHSQTYALTGLAAKREEWDQDLVVFTHTLGGDTAGARAKFDQVLDPILSGISTDPWLGGTVELAQVTGVHTQEAAPDRGARQVGAVVTVHVTAVAKGSTIMSSQRPPAAHAGTHASSGSDPLALEPSQVTGLTGALAGKVDDDDPRLTDPREPTAHAASHGDGGADEITLTQAQVAGLVEALAALVADTDPRLSDDRDPTAHAGDHAEGGTDPVTLTQAQVTGLVDALAGKAATDDPRLSDARTPTAHAASHAAGQADALTLTQAQITNLVADLAAKAALAGATFTGRIIVPSGAAGGVSVGGPLHLSGTGSPEGVVSAPVGSTWIDTAATTGAIRWIKASGTGNTGWRVEDGDTGQRDVTAAVTNPANGTLGVVMLRRIGSVVILSGRISSTAATAGVIWTLPAGFRPATYATARGGAMSGTDQPVLVQAEVSGDVTVRTWNTSTTNRYWTLTFLTSDGWPASLPGS